MIIKQQKQKTCDVCKQIVAKKSGLFWNTRMTYFQFGKVDTGFAEGNLHFCEDCWRQLKLQILSARCRKGGGSDGCRDASD